MNSLVLRSTLCAFRLCVGTIKAHLDIWVKRIWSCTRPIGRGCAALGEPFGGVASQRTKKRKSPLGEQGGFWCNELGDRRTLRRCAIGRGSKAGGGLSRDALGGENTAQGDPREAGRRSERSPSCRRDRKPSQRSISTRPVPGKMARLNASAGDSARSI